MSLAEDNTSLFEEILSVFQKAGILNNLLLVGSWSYIIYREYFGNPPEIPIIRTADVDFVLNRPPHITASTDLPKLLKKNGFIMVIDPDTRHEKFEHPNLEIEFLIQEGRTGNKVTKIKELNIYAQPLRLLDFLFYKHISIKYKNISVNVPDPVIFIFHKLLISQRREGVFKSKKKKDISCAIDLANFLLEKQEYKNKFSKEFQEMNKKRQSIILKLLKEEFAEDLLKAL